MKKNCVLLMILLVIVALTLSGCPEETSTTENSIQANVNDILRYPFYSNDNWYLSQDFCDYYAKYAGYHSAEDWNCAQGDGDAGRPVYSIAKGKVIGIGSTYKDDKVGSEAGFYIIIKHTGSFIIPAKSGSGFAYDEDPDAEVIYSVYMHVTPESWVTENTEITAELLDEPIAKLSGGMSRFPSHLHFEIRVSKDTEVDPVGSALKTTKTGYFSNTQEIVDLGYRDPSSIIEANGGKLMSQGQVLGTETSKPTTVFTTTIPATPTPTPSPTPTIIATPTPPLINETADGYIYKVNKSGSIYSLEIDYVEVLYPNTDRKKLIAALKEDGLYDNKYSEEYNLDQYYPLGYRRNRNDKIRVFDIADNATLQLDVYLYNDAFNKNVTASQPCELVDISLDEFMDFINNHQMYFEGEPFLSLFKVTIKDSRVIEAVDYVEP